MHQEKITALYDYLTNKPSESSKPSKLNKPSKPNKSEGQIHKITRKQKVVLTLLSRGLNNKQIASEVGCSYSTIQNMLNLMYKNAKIPAKYNKRVKLVLLYHETMEMSKM